jgi:Icc-related predicted phosphoesterase
MTIIGLTDIHGTIAHLERIEEKVQAADWVLLGGDITHFGDAAAAAAIINPIRQLNPNIFAVTGNCDEPAVDEYLIGEGIGGHGRVIRSNDWTILGLGGSLPAPVFTPNTFSEEEYETFFTRLQSSFGSSPDILVSHQPPWKTKLDRVWGMKHVGSRVLRSYIERTAPRLVFCGHIHESSGIDKIGSTFLVNPGPFRHGNYARIILDDEAVEIELF